VSPGREDPDALMSGVKWKHLTRWFIETWQILANLGDCDEIGGCEFRRVFQEFLRVAPVPDLAVFIRQEANRLPSSFTPEDKKGNEDDRY
jgi:hypothetical protein